jgi:hypothetical protein
MKKLIIWLILPFIMGTVEFVLGIKTDSSWQSTIHIGMYVLWGYALRWITS